jgi:glutathione reductase (NADPH)
MWMTNRRAAVPSAEPSPTPAARGKRRASQASQEPRPEVVPRSLRRPRQTHTREADLVVIGGGSGGMTAATRAARHGARVILIERDAMGGTCVNRGCVPKKMLSYGATLAAVLSGCLAHTGAREDWRDAIVRVNAEVARLNVVYTERMQKAGVTLLRGDASLIAPNLVRVGDESLRAGRVLIATGSRPRRLPVPGGELASSSDDVFTWQSVPASIVVVGGGYIGVEQASILSRYGVRVDMLVASERLLPGFDEEMSEALAETLAAKGIRVHLKTEVTLIDQANGALEVCYRRNGTAGKVEAIRAQAVLAAVGREAVTEGLGLQEQGVTLGERGGVVVNRYFRSALRSVYAVGDVIEDGLQLTPVAIAQGRWIADRLFGRRGDAADFATLPTAVFCEPAIGVVGLTEARAIEALGKPERVRTVVRRFVSLENRFAGSTQASFFKLVLDARSGRVLGAHLMDNAAPEIIQTLAVALRLGLKEAHLKTTVQVHPTVAEELFG